MMEKNLFAQKQLTYPEDAIFCHKKIYIVNMTKNKHLKIRFLDISFMYFFLCTYVGSIHVYGIYYNVNLRLYT